jgi:uncharacterized protein YecE (DUF72 family)
MAFDRETVQEYVAKLASAGVYVGTSSWKYEGWLGQLYDPLRYASRGKLIKSRFDAGCLSEYGEVFKTVCIDAAYYTFPSARYLAKLEGQVPDDFRFGLKVTDSITLKHYPRLDRFGIKAGKPNADFLNSDLFTSEFLQPCETIRDKIGIIMLEFSHFRKADYAFGRDFVADLDQFFARIPKGWPLGVELRNRTWLVPEYFTCLRKHGVAHVFNSWQAMPSVEEQLKMPDSRTNPELAAARFLLKPGRKYADAVEAFRPYDQVKEEYPEGRSAASQLIREGLRSGVKKTYLYVNNRLEGNALATIAAILPSLTKAAVASGTIELEPEAMGPKD